MSASPFCPRCRVYHVGAPCSGGWLDIPVRLRNPDNLTQITRLRADLALERRRAANNAEAAKVWGEKCREACDEAVRLRSALDARDAEVEALEAALKTARADALTALPLLQEAADCLDRHLGDSDPIDGPESDDEFAEEYPAVWACNRINVAIRALAEEKDDA